VRRVAISALNAYLLPNPRQVQLDIAVALFLLRNCAVGRDLPVRSPESVHKMAKDDIDSPEEMAAHLKRLIERSRQLRDEVNTFLDRPMIEETRSLHSAQLESRTATADDKHRRRKKDMPRTRGR
jgi:hypothetical protein